MDRAKILEAEKSRACCIEGGTWRIKSAEDFVNALVRQENLGRKGEVGGGSTLRTVPSKSHTNCHNL